MWAWGGVVAALTALCLWPIWSAELLPFQDYPSHLFQVKVLASPGDFPADHFEISLRLGPYSGFYLATLALAKILPVETAGRVFLSAYVFLVAALAVVLGRRAKSPWQAAGALLIFPFAMNQQYLLGNTNFFFAIPLAIFALLDFDGLLDERCGPLRGARQVGWQLLVLLFHPLVFLGVVGLTGAAVAWHSLRRRKPDWLLALPVAGLVVYALTASRVASGGGWYWFPISRTIYYFALAFCDFQSPRGILFPGVVGWLPVAVLLAVAALRSPADSVRARWGVHVLLALLAVLVLPFGKKPDWTFVNMRLSCLCYFLIAIWAAKVPLARRGSIAIAALVLLITGSMVATQLRLARELKSLAVLLPEIPPGAAVLPVVYSGASPELDHAVFQPWLHAADYDWLRRETNVYPNILQSPLMPVAIPPAKAFPGPRLDRPEDFRWSEHAGPYEYFLLCGRPTRAQQLQFASTEVLMESGPWLLLRKVP